MKRRTWIQWLNPFTRVERWFTFIAFIWFTSASLVLYVAFTRSGMKLPASFAIYLLLTVACSVVAFTVYGIDKRRAVRDKPRISERTLHLLGALGGWPGAHFARRLFRHKSLKVSFRLIFWIIVGIHLTVITFGLIWLSWWTYVWDSWWTCVLSAIWKVTA